LLNIFLRKVGIVLVCFSVFWGILLCDSVSSDRIDWKKTGVFFILITGVVLTGLDPKAVQIGTYITGDKSVMTYGLYKYFSILAPAWSGVMLTYYFMKIHRKAPSHMKKYSALMIFGSAVGFVMAFAIGLGINNQIPALLQILISLSSVSISYAMIQEPKLAFILPFKVNRLNVIATNTGIPIFSYVWNTDERIDLSDQAIFSGLVHGINLFASEALKSGEVQEVILESATIILESSDEYPIVCVLIANRSSSAIRSALHNFAEHFFAEYASKIKQEHELAVFKSADELIKKYFPFVPKY
jgi:hypothetical protein